MGKRRGLFWRSFLATELARNTPEVKWTTEIGGYVTKQYFEKGQIAASAGSLMSGGSSGDKA